MKTLIAVLSALLIIGVAYADIHSDAEELLAKEQAPKAPEPFLCPVSKISDNDKCMTCHQMVIEQGKPKFGLKEILLESSYEAKPFALEIMQEGDAIVGYYVLSGISPSVVEKINRYLLENLEIKKLIIEIHSPGGSVMDAWRIIGLIEEMKARGIEIETRCNGVAASAGAILLVAGDKRLVSPHAEIMIHKVWQFSMFDIADPDSAEDKAEVLKHFQRNINEWFASRTKISVKELNSNTFHKMWWLTGLEAVELGVATGLIGE